MRSLLVLLAGVGVLIAITPRPQGEAVRVVDVAAPLAQARQTAPYDVLAPSGLGARWRPTSARVRVVGDGRHRWQVGFLTPHEQYAALVQSDEDPGEFVAAQAKGAVSAGSDVIGGKRWIRLENDAGNHRVLWRPATGSTVVLAGTASWAELGNLAASLRVAGGK